MLESFLALLSVVVQGVSIFAVPTGFVWYWSGLWFPWAPHGLGVVTFAFWGATALGGVTLGSAGLALAVAWSGLAAWRENLVAVLLILLGAGLAAVNTALGVVSSCGFLPCLAFGLLEGVARWLN